MNKIKKVYLDYAGTTPMDTQVKRVILRYMDESWGNSSSVHEYGRKASELIDQSRIKVARVLGCKDHEIIFTGSGTESDNLAILGIARAYKKLGNHIVTSKIEHPAVLQACRYLEENEGFKLTYVSVDSRGLVNPDEISKSLTNKTILVSIMYANNEIGTIQPIAEIAKIIKERRDNKKTVGLRVPFFHTDACQAAGALNIKINNLGVDLMTLNGSKIYGPKATGCLSVKRGINLIPILLGGLQEMGRRAGTENQALIAGFAEALELSDQSRGKESTRLTELRDYAVYEIKKKIPGSHLNGDQKKRLPNNINFSFEGVDGEMLMIKLDQAGIMVSTGSACTTTSTEPSHVLEALGLGPDLVNGNIRITLGRQTNKKDIDHVLKKLYYIVGKLRKTF
ncbi:MAG TPA: cysteine desulfurase family protein [Candidatus Paceibacterota bacterium]